MADMTAEQEAVTRTLQQLHDVIGARFPAIATSYIENSRAILKRLAQGVQTENWDQVAEAAHQLKGSASHFGSRQLPALCDQVNRLLCEPCDRESISTILGRLGEANSVIIDALLHFLNSIDPQGGH
jgi:HPt (histidine-containing phosphotransfer) domain-containing protein